MHWNSSKPFALLLCAVILAEPYLTEIGPHTVTMTIEWVGPYRAHVTAHTTIPVPQGRIWTVLTDYDHLEEFVPLMELSKVIQRDGPVILLYQRGSIRLPFYRKDLEVTFHVEEKPREAIHFEAVKGDFLIYRGSWELQKTAEGVRIDYEATLEPAAPLPRWVMAHLERWLLRATFRAIIKRCLAA